MARWDTALHWTIRVLAATTLVLFLYALFALSFPAFIGALETGIVAYILLRVDVEKHPLEAGVEDLRADDEEEPPTEADAEAVYALQAAGIPLSFERRNRGTRRRG